MATFGFVFKEGRLDLRVEHRGMERFVPTHYQVREQEWDAETGWLAVGNMVTARHRKLHCYQRAMTRDLRRLRAAVGDMEHTRASISVDDIASAYRQMMAGYQVMGIYAQVLADETAREGRPRTARGYLTAARRFVEFNGGYDIRHDAITSETIIMFERALEDEELTPNTISFYMRTLRAIYNRAVAECILPARLDDPFEDAYTRIEPPVSPVVMIT